MISPILAYVMRFMSVYAFGALLVKKPDTLFHKDTAKFLTNFAPATILLHANFANLTTFDFKDEAVFYTFSFTFALLTASFTFSAP